jgi:hypothetical protein
MCRPSKCQFVANFHQYEIHLWNIRMNDFIGSQAATSSHRSTSQDCSPASHPRVRTPTATSADKCLRCLRVGTLREFLRSCQLPTDATTHPRASEQSHIHRRCHQLNGIRCKRKQRKSFHILNEMNYSDCRSRLSPPALHKSFI